MVASDSAWPWMEDEEIIVYPDLIDAFIGFSWQFSNGPLATYDKDKVIQIFIDRDEMTYDDAVEYFEVNTMGLWVGERTPVFVTLTQNLSEGGD